MAAGPVPCNFIITTSWVADSNTNVTVMTNAPFRKFTLEGGAWHAYVQFPLPSTPRHSVPGRRRMRCLYPKVIHSPTCHVLLRSALSGPGAGRRSQIQNGSPVGFPLARQMRDPNFVRRGLSDPGLPGQCGVVCFTEPTRTSRPSPSRVKPSHYYRPPRPSPCSPGGRLR